MERQWPTCCLDEHTTRVPNEVNADFWIAVIFRMVLAAQDPRVACPFLRKLTNQLVSSGHESVSKQDQHFTHLGFSAAFHTTHVGDYWQFPR